MRAWYDLTGLVLVHREDAEGIMRSAQLIKQLIAREIERGVAAQNIILAGFSQGGAMALYTGLRYSEPLAGIIALSSYLPLAERLAAEAHTANNDTPIFMAHGSFDPVVPLPLGDHSHQWLQTHGYNVDWHTYPMQHSVNPDEIRDLGEWLRNRLVAMQAQ